MVQLFFLRSKEQWPKDIPKSKLTTDMICETPAGINTSAVVARKLSPELMDLSHYSSFVKACRITAYVQRFIAEEERQKWKFKELRRRN